MNTLKKREREKVKQKMPLFTVAQIYIYRCLVRHLHQDS